jgi:Pentapeptide repeats (8 copies)
VTAQEARSPAQGIAETLDRLIGETERDTQASFAALARAAGLDPARDFIGAFLANLDFRDEDLRGFDFSRADLTGADFRRARIAGVCFDGAILRGPSEAERKLARARPSGRRLSAADVSLVKGMVGRGDRHHDVAAWFGGNQGRIAEVIAGELYPEALAAPLRDLPPKGSPGRIARIAMEALQQATQVLEFPGSAPRAKEILDEALEEIREGE